MQRLQLPNQERITELWVKEDCGVLGILETNTIKHPLIKEKLKQFLRITINFSNHTLIQKSHQRAKYLGSLSCQVFKTIFKLTREELNQVDERTRKLVSIHKALHPRDDIDYVSHKMNNEEDSALLKIV